MKKTLTKLFIKYILIIYLFTINSLNLSQKEVINNQQRSKTDHNFLETDSELSATDYFGNIQKLQQTDEKIGKDLYDYFKNDIHKKENNLEYNNKFELSSIKNKIESNGYKLFENLINMIEKQPDKIFKVDTHKMMHFSDQNAKFKEVINGLSDAEKKFKFRETENNSENDNIKSEGVRFEDGPIDIGNLNIFMG